MFDQLIILLGIGVWMALWLLRDSRQLWVRRGAGLAGARRPALDPLPDRRALIVIAAGPAPDDLRVG